MSAAECVVCAWRATCNLKFNYQSSELHCREFSRDVTLPGGDGDIASGQENGEPKKPDEK